MRSVIATFTRIERALWVLVILSLIGLLGLGLPLGMLGEGGRSWEWIARIAVALLGITALAARAYLQPARRRVAELSTRLTEAEAQAAASRRATRAESLPALGDLATIRSLAADIERRARVAAERARLAAERARVAEGEAKREAASLGAMLERLRELGVPPLDDAAHGALDASVSQSATTLAENVERSAAQRALLSERAAKLAGQVEAIAGSQASLAVGLSSLEGLSDRADALSLRCARAEQGLATSPGEVASDLAAIAQEMAASIAGLQAALSTGREASSRALLEAREHVDAADRAAAAERHLATSARTLGAKAEDAARAATSLATQARSQAATEAGAIAKALDEFATRHASATVESPSGEEIEDLARETGHLQAMLARLGAPGPP